MVLGLAREMFPTLELSPPPLSLGFLRLKHSTGKSKLTSQDSQMPWACSDGSIAVRLFSSHRSIRALAPQSPSPRKTQLPRARIPPSNTTPQISQGARAPSHTNLFTPYFVFCQTLPNSNTPPHDSEACRRNSENLPTPHFTLLSERTAPHVTFSCAHLSRSSSATFTGFAPTSSVAVPTASICGGTSTGSPPRTIASATVLLPLVHALSAPTTLLLLCFLLLVRAGGSPRPRLVCSPP